MDIGEVETVVWRHSVTFNFHVVLSCGGHTAFLFFFFYINIFNTLPVLCWTAWLFNSTIVVPPQFSYVFLFTHSRIYRYNLTNNSAGMESKDSRARARACHFSCATSRSADLTSFLHGSSILRISPVAYIFLFLIQMQKSIKLLKKKN